MTKKKNSITNALGPTQDDSSSQLSVIKEIYDGMIIYEEQFQKQKAAFLKKNGLTELEYKKAAAEYDKMVLKDAAKEKDKQLNQEQKKKQKLSVKERTAKAKERKEELKAAKELNKLAQEQLKQESDVNSEEYKLKKELLDKEAEQLKKQEKQNKKELAIAKTKETVSNVGAQALNAAVDAADASIKEAVELLSEYKGKVSARLQGSESSWDSLAEIATATTSGYYKNKTLMQNLISLTEQGITYNIEQRAFLQTVSEKIADTFDAANGTLTRLIKIQQADSTSTRLGLEAALTKYFNSTFSDNSYLSDNINESVNAALLGTLSSMSREAGVEFEYIVQKWLGSLYSVGVSEDTITKIAAGLEYLGTGQVESLTSDTELQTLFGLAANNAGLSYEELVQSNLSIDNTNKLLKSIVEILNKANSESNNVLRATWANLYGVSVADLNAVQNLSSSSISNIYSNFLNYGALNGELKNQLTTGIAGRTSMQEYVANVIENYKYNIGLETASSPLSYIMYQLFDLLDATVEGIRLPAAFGFDLNTSVADLGKLATVLGSTLGDIGKLANAVGDYDQGIQGDALAKLLAIPESLSIKTSGSGFSLDANSTARKTYVATGSSSDVENSLIQQGSASGAETSKVSNSGFEEQQEDTLYKVGEYDANNYLMVNLAGGPLSEDKKSLLVSLTSSSVISDLVNFLQSDSFADKFANRFISASKTNNLGVTGTLQLVAKTDVTATGITSITNDIDKASIIDTEELQAAMMEAVKAALESTQKRFDVNVSGVGISTVTNTLPVSLVGSTTGL